MRALYLASVWLHVLAAMAWIGGMLFLVLVLVPSLRDSDFVRVRTTLLLKTGLRFRQVGWVMLGLLVLTGLTNLEARGYDWVHALDGSLWQGAWGRTLSWKLVLVVTILIISGLHDFYVGPRAVQRMAADEKAPDSHRLRRTAGWMGRLNLLLALAVLVLAVALVRGGL